MASVADTLKHSLLEFPTLYSGDIGKVFHHMFFVNGNGMDWEDGELVDIVKRDRIPTTEEGWAALAEKNRAELAGQAEIIRKENLKYGGRMLTSYLLDCHNYEFVAKHIDDIVHEDAWCHQRIKRCSLTSLSRYAGILHVPENVKPDWLWAAYHHACAVQYAVNPYSCPDPNKQELAYRNLVAHVVSQLQNMLIARGLMATLEEQERLLTEVLREIKNNKAGEDDGED